MNEERGRHTPLWRRALGMRRRTTWHDQHPLPHGWRPRTRIDDRGREVEPWVFLVVLMSSRFSPELDGGEWWLPVGRDPDEAAFEILGAWLDICAPAAALTAAERRAVMLSARRAGYSAVAGVAYGAEVVPAPGQLR